MIWDSAESLKVGKVVDIAWVSCWSKALWISLKHLFIPANLYFKLSGLRCSHFQLFRE